MNIPTQFLGQGYLNIYFEIKERGQDTMKVETESYKGIEFVRISSLPDEQRELFWDSFNPQKIIKILRGNELLNDCLQYEDYQDWYTKRFSPAG